MATTMTMRDGAVRTGTAATALAVSWVAGAMTVMGRASPSSSATDRRIGPSSVPGSIRSGRIARGMPRPRQSSSDQVPLRGSSNWVVEASVRSPARRPVKSQPKRSGIISSVSADSRSGDFDLRQGQELIERVERQELQAGDLVDPLARDALERRVEHAVGPRVAIMHRVAQQGIAPSDQAEIDAPGIDADAVELAAGRSRLPQRDLELLEEPGQVPVERIEHPDRAVGEAMDLLQLEPLAVEAAQEPPAALGAQVQRQVIARLGHVRRFSRRARWLRCGPFLRAG